MTIQALLVSAIPLVLAFSFADAAAAQPAGPRNDPTTRAAAAEQRIEVRVDPRVELLSIIFRLAGAEEFSSPIPGYSAAIDSFFGPHRHHPVTDAVRRLRQERGISYDAVMSFAVHLTGVPELGNRMPFEGSQIESRWTPGEATAFADLVRSFARESRAERFFAAHQPLYAVTAARMQALIREHVDQQWFTSFFGRTSARFVLVTALNNGGIAYYTRFHPPDGARELYAVINVVDLDADQQPTFATSQVPVIVHEFAHAFVNPVVDANYAAIRPAAEVIQAPVAAAMRGQGYPEARTIISESLVRAAVVRYVHHHRGIDSARVQAADERLRSFFWIDELLTLYGAYAHAREQYPTFESYWPVLSGFFKDLAPRMAGLLAEADRRRPAVVAIAPTDGSVDVNPGLDEITVTFDRPMRPSYATMLIGPDGKQHFPEVLSNTWDPTRRVFTMRVRLQPGRSYRIALNSAAVSGFVSEEGHALAPVRIRFTTAPAAIP